MCSVSIIIINYNTFELTCRCIESIFEKEKNLDFEIILVDNASSEINPAEFKRKFPKIVLIESPENVGFAKGNNLGIDRAQGKHILLLNSDTVLKNNAVKILSTFLRKDSDVAAVASKLEHANGTVQHNCQRFPSIRYKLFELLRLQKLLPKSIGGKLLLGSFFDHQSVVFPDWVWGTSFMVRKELLEILPQKKLADDFFMYGEDMQWCLEFKKLGYRIAFEPAAEIVHFMGMSGGDKNRLMEHHLNLLLKKYYSRFHITCIQLLDRLLA